MAKTPMEGWFSDMETRPPIDQFKALLQQKGIYGQVEHTKLATATTRIVVYSVYKLIAEQLSVVLKYLCALALRIVKTTWKKRVAH